MTDDANDKPDDDKKIKELLDPKTRADLERWFAMPSFEQLAERGVVPAPPPREEDPEIAARRKRRDEALAAADPGLIEAHRARTSVSDTVSKFKLMVEPRVDPSIALLDVSMIDRGGVIAEPRERELPFEIQDDLRACAPQALLRDLHRPELDFEKVFEVVDAVAEQRLDAAEAVAEVMRTRWTMEIPKQSPLAEARDLIKTLRDDRHRPWTEIRMPNRTVTE